MEAWLERYQTLVAQQPVCDDSWFPAALQEYRAGDELAGRRISAGCLWLALQVAQSRAGDLEHFPLLDLVQEANAGLVDALEGFAGSTTADFVRQATTAIDRRFHDLVSLT